MYTRLLALGLIDSVLTLPITIAELVITRLRSVNDHPFWPGWRTAHANTAAVFTSTTEEWKLQGTWFLIELRFSQWSGPFAALVFFALFGLTEQKRAQYRDLFWKVLKPFGLISPRTNLIVSSMRFRSGPMVSGAFTTLDMTV